LNLVRRLSPEAVSIRRKDAFVGLARLTQPAVDHGKHRSQSDHSRLSRTGRANAWRGYDRRASLKTRLIRRALMQDKELSS